jgi:fused signal recognition particle receptor
LFTENYKLAAEMAATTSASFSRFSVISKPPSQTQFNLFNFPNRTGIDRFRCSAGEVGLFTKLGRLLKEKAKSDVEKVFSGFSKTRNNLSVIDELLLYWNLSDTDKVLDELEEVPLLQFQTLFFSNLLN